MKRRDFFRSLAIAPAAIVGVGVEEDRKSKYLEIWRKGRMPVYTTEDPNWRGWSVQKHGPGWTNQ